MINMNKSTEKTNTAQIAGLLPGDSNIEFIGLKETKQVIWLQHGRTLEWAHLPKWIYNVCKKQYLQDKNAVEFLQKAETSVNRQVELYIYHLYGGMDAMPDVLNGKLTICENFRDEKNTPSLNWSSKRITLNGTVLTLRDLKIIDLVIQDEPDKAMAAEFNIAQSTFDFHKRNLFKRANVKTKAALIVAVFTHQI